MVGLTNEIGAPPKKFLSEMFLSFSKSYSIAVYGVTRWWNENRFRYFCSKENLLMEMKTRSFVF